MPRANKFAAGKYAWGICDVCGIRSRLVDLRETTVRARKTGLLSCPECWDPDHPQNFLDRFVTNDPQALRRPRPDTGLDDSRQLYPPGNWINGQPPTLERQAADMAVERAAQAKSKLVDQAEQKAWLEGDQIQQKGV